jgi:hypothetical protein
VQVVGRANGLERCLFVRSTSISDSVPLEAAFARPHVLKDRLDLGYLEMAVFGRTEGSKIANCHAFVQFHRFPGNLSFQFYV